MDALAELYLQRAETELVAAQVLLEISNNEELQREQFKIEKNFTFYSSVISHSYYCMFYSAKAILINDGIRTYAPEDHKKMIDAFENHFVKSGKLDVQLLMIYQRMIMRAEELLGIYSLEKGKRGKYPSQKLPQANLEPAEESLENASLFFKNISSVLRKSSDADA